jgi:hypothetical protein
VVEKKVFVVYGYHQNEKFAIEVGERLAQEHLDDVVVKMYGGKRPQFNSMDDRREWSLRNYLRENLPFDCGVILHDGGPGPEEIGEYENPPCICFMYNSKHDISDFLVKKLRNHFRLKRKPENPILSSFRTNLRNMSREYDKIDIEYIPSLISLVDGLDFLKGLVNILKTE